MAAADCTVQSIDRQQGSHDVSRENSGGILMDSGTFDTLARKLGKFGSRRYALGAILGGLLSSTSLAVQDDVEAKRRRRGKKSPGKKKPPKKYRYCVCNAGGRCKQQRLTLAQMKQRRNVLRKNGGAVRKGKCPKRPPHEPCEFEVCGTYAGPASCPEGFHCEDPNGSYGACCVPDEPTCGEEYDTCGYDTDCCPGLTCQYGKCTPPPCIPNNPCTEGRCGTWQDNCGIPHECSCTGDYEVCTATVEGHCEVQCRNPEYCTPYASDCCEGFECKEVNYRNVCVAKYAP